MPIAKVKLKSNHLKNIKLQPYKIKVYMMSCRMDIDFYLDGMKGDVMNSVGSLFDVYIGGDEKGSYMVTGCQLDFSMMTGRITMERFG